MRPTIRVAAGLGVAAILGACGGSTANLGGTPQDGGGGGGGPTIIATEIQETPTSLVSDGTSLFWVSSDNVGGPLERMSVTGGAITAVVSGMLPGSSDLAVDEVNVYYQGQTGELYRAPKDGSGSPTLISEGGALVGGWTTLGANAYWTKRIDGAAPAENTTVVIESAPLEGGAISVLGQFTSQGPSLGSGIGVDSTTVFISSITVPLSYFAESAGIADGGVPTPASGTVPYCSSILSDTDGAYCAAVGSILALHDDGTTTTVGALDTMYQQGLMALDDTYVYWVDSVMVGTIMRAPKAGGTATIIARDANPIAIAVDANAIYWSDEGGNITRLAK